MNEYRHYVDTITVQSIKMQWIITTIKTDVFGKGTILN